MAGWLDWLDRFDWLDWLDNRLNWSFNGFCFARFVFAINSTLVRLFFFLLFFSSTSFPFPSPTTETDCHLFDLVIIILVVDYINSST